MHTPKTFIKNQKGGIRITTIVITAENLNRFLLGEKVTQQSYAYQNLIPGEMATWIAPNKGQGLAQILTVKPCNTPPDIKITLEKLDQ